MFPWKQSWGGDFLYRKWQHFKLFQATEILLLLKQRETTVLMWEPRTGLCSSSGGFPSPLQFQEIQPSPCGSRASHEATWGHQPAAAPGAHWKGPHGVISGIFFFCRLPEKAQRTPQVQLQGKWGGDGWDEGATKEFPFSDASAVSQPVQLPKWAVSLSCGMAGVWSDHQNFQVFIWVPGKPLPELLTTIWITYIISYCQWVQLNENTSLHCKTCSWLYKILKCFISGLQVQVRTKP